MQTLTPALIVAVLALLFTVGSFYWIQVRRGRLRSYEFHFYSGQFTQHETNLLLPLVLHNTGPAPIVVVSFRLILDVGGERLTMPWNAMQRQLDPRLDRADKPFPSPIAVAGRTATEQFIEFKLRRQLDYSRGPYSAEVEVLLGHKTWVEWIFRRQRKWRKLLAVALHTELVSTADAAVTYMERSNDPDWSVD